MRCFMRIIIIKPNEHDVISSVSREIPYGRNENNRTRITDQANTLNATVIARSAATWQSPGREDLLAYTDKILAGGGFLHCVRTIVLTPVEMAS